VASLRRPQPARSTIGGPPGHWLLGHSRPLQHDPLGYLLSVGRAHGNARLRFGPFPMLLLSDPRAIEEVLVTRQRLFEKSLTTHRLRLIVGNGLLTSEGASWRSHRRLVQPAFHRDRIAGYAATMSASAAATAESWSDGEERRLVDDLSRLTLDVVARCLFGTDLDEQAPLISAAITSATEPLYDRLSTFWVFAPDGFPTPHSRAFRRANATFDRAVTAVVERRQAAGSVGSDLLGLLLAARDEDGRPMSRREVRDELVTLLLAGHDTSAMALTWALVLLSQAPAVEAELHAELDAVLNGRPAGLDDLSRLVLTRRVVDETMRLYPPAWIIERSPRATVTIAGERVRPGTTVILCPWVTHRDPRWFEEPDSFRPERWAAPSVARLPRFAYFPFGGGARVCLGTTFALTETTLLLATLAQRWRFELLPGQSLAPQPRVTLRPAGGLRVRVHARRQERGAQRPGMARALTAR
jgi:cytochrome P450